MVIGRLLLSTQFTCPLHQVFFSVVLDNDDGILRLFGCSLLGASLLVYTQSSLLCKLHIPFAKQLTWWRRDEQRKWLRPYGEDATSATPHAERA